LRKDRVGRMELSLITPANYFTFSRILPGRFCIASAAFEHPEYKEFFKKEAQRGKRVVLDNGVFENDQLDQQILLDLAQEIQPKVLIVPDVISSNAQVNWQYAKTFVTCQPKTTYFGGEWMFVPQCKMDDTKGFERVLRDVIKSKEFKWIGICRDAVANAYSKYTNTDDQELNRLFFSWHCSQLIGDALANGKRFHFLGIGDNVWALQHYWYVDAMDTASFFWQGSLGNIVHQGVLQTRLRRPKDYFEREYTSCPYQSLVQNVRFNCEAALVFAQEADKLRRRVLREGRV